MRVIDLFKKIADNEEVKDFTVEDGDVVFGIIDGIIVNKTDKNIARWSITDQWLNSEVHFVKEKKRKDETNIECFF